MVGAGTRERKGKSRRRGIRESNLQLKCPYIKRNIPPYDLLGEEALVNIEQGADRLLKDVGIELRDDEETVRLFREAGASIKEKDANVWMMHCNLDLLKSILKTAPETFTQHARNPAHSVEIGGNAVVFAPAYGSPFILDAEGKRRYGTLEDFQTLIKLAQASPWLHHSGGTVCEPTDIPVNKRHMDMVYAHMRYSDRPFLGSVTDPERVVDSVEMCRLLFGADFVDKNCVIMGNFNATSPLVWDDVALKGIRVYAEANQGSIHTPFLLGGAVAPITMPGAVAQNLAESLVGCALAQLVRPGAPVVFGSFVSSMNMRSGSPTFGTPEPAIATLVLGQMVRRLKLPLRAGGGFTTSKMPDAQAMSQTMMSMMSAIQSGAHYILHAAGFLDGLLSMSFEKFVIDSDMCGMLHAYLKGVEVDEETVAVESLAEKGPGAHLFGTAHTLRHYQDAFWDSETNDDLTYETWSEAGSEDSMVRANRMVRERLEAYTPPALDENIDGSLQEFIAKRKEAMPDAWY